MPLFFVQERPITVVLEDHRPHYLKGRLIPALNQQVAGRLDHVVKCEKEAERAWQRAPKDEHSPVAVGQVFDDD